MFLILFYSIAKIIKYTILTAKRKFQKRINKYKEGLLSTLKLNMLKIKAGKLLKIEGFYNINIERFLLL